MPVKMLRRHVMLGASAAMLTPFGVRVAMAAAATPIKIANTFGTINMLMQGLMAQQKFLESFDIDPTILKIADGSRILAGIVGGSIQATTMAGFGQVFPAIEHGAQIKILAGGALPPTLAMYTSRPNIKTLKDLEGKTIGTGSVGALVWQLTVTLLKKYNVDISKVRFVNIGSSSDIFKAVSAGEIDAGAGEGAKLDEAAAFHVYPIEDGNMTINLPEYTYQGAWVSQKMIDTNRDLLVRTLAAYAKLYRFVQNPSSKDAVLAAQRAVFSTGLDATSDAVWDYIQKYKPFAVDLVLSPERLNYMQNLNIGFKVQTKILPFDQVADMSIAEDAIKLLG